MQSSSLKNSDDVTAAFRVSSPTLPRKLQMVALQVLACVSLDTSQTLDHVEVFAGFAKVTRVFLDAGVSALSCELRQDAVFQNLFTHSLLKLKPGGCLLAAPVCSSWASTDEPATDPQRHLWAGTRCRTWPPPPKKRGGLDPETF